MSAVVRTRDTYVRRPNPVVVLWRWRYEVLAAAAFGATGWAVAHGAVPLWALLAAANAAMAAAVVPALRRRLLRRVLAVAIAHRVRVGCAEAGVHTALGRLPVVYRVSPRAYGERVRVWCLGAVRADDFRAVRETLAAACWADEVRVVAHPRCAQLVTLYVVRRPAGCPPADDGSAYPEGDVTTRVVA